MTEADYGYLFCWAENIAGHQREPCRFEVVRESPPDPPIYCQPLNVTWEHIEATCQPGKVYSFIRFTGVNNCPDKHQNLTIWGTLFGGALQL